SLSFLLLIATALCTRAQPLPGESTSQGGTGPVLLEAGPHHRLWALPEPAGSSATSAVTASADPTLAPAPARARPRRVLELGTGMNVWSAQQQHYVPSES